VAATIFLNKVLFFQNMGSAPPFSIDYQANLPCSIISNFVTNFIKQEHYMSTPENTSKNRTLLG